MSHAIEICTLKLLSWPIHFRAHTPTTWLSGFELSFILNFVSILIYEAYFTYGDQIIIENQFHTLRYKTLISLLLQPPEPISVQIYTVLLIVLL